MRFTRAQGKRSSSYGMTETGMNTSNPLSARDLPARRKALPGVSIGSSTTERRRMRAQEVGNSGQGSERFAAIWRMGKDARGFSSDGYFKTGDLAVDDRALPAHRWPGTDLIISGGPMSSEGSRGPDRRHRRCRRKR